MYNEDREGSTKLQRDEQTQSTDMVELDLPSASCNDFEVICEFTASPEAYTLATELVTGSDELAERPDVMYVTKYASQYEIGNNKIQVVGMLARPTVTGERSLVLQICYYGWGRTPSLPDGVEPMSNLLAIFPRLLHGQPVEFDCDASFHYHLGERLRSRVSLPYPLLLAEPSSNDSFTHVESVTLSRREGNEPTHTVVVEQGVDGTSIAHYVSFNTNIVDGTTALSRLPDIFGVAGRLSMSLLDRPMEEM